MKRIILAIALLALGSAAFAQQPKPRPALTGNIAADLKSGALTGNLETDAQTVWNKIVAANQADLAYASALAASVNTPAGATRKQCWDALLAANKQAQGTNLKNADGTPMVKPDPHTISDVEGFAETVDNLSPQGTLYTSCAGAAQLAKRNVLQVINGLITGVAAFTATGGLIP